MNTQQNTANLQPSDQPQTIFDDDDYSFDIVNSGNDATMSSPTLISPSSSGPPLFPKPNIAKPSRRRSRASRKAPMTLLNASPNNFRALVQQFTGCHSAPAAFGAWKGPINLNFAQYSYYPDKPEAQQQRPCRNPREDSAPSLSSNSISAAAATTTTTDMFAASAGPAGSLNNMDDFDMESLQVQEPPGPGDYYSASPETWDDDFWGM